MRGFLLSCFFVLSSLAFPFASYLPIPGEKEREINLSEAVKLHKQNVAFVDARPIEVFYEGHIKRAVSLSTQNFDSSIVKFKLTYPDSLPLVIYCGGIECSDSHDLADLLYRNGYFNIRIFIDGYPAWEAANMPIETSSTPQK
jgi:rhodanese-related sulfurtransferase